MSKNTSALMILKRHRSALLVAGFLGLLTCVTLNNLILNFGTLIPGDTSHDYAIPFWSLWWAKHALLDLHTNPMFTNYILFPNTVNLTLHSHILTLGILSLPFQYFLDMRLIVNGITVLSFLLSSTLMYAFLNRRVDHPWLSVDSARIRFRAMTYPADQTVTVSVNGYTVGAVHLTSDWTDYEFTLLADALRTDGPAIITLTHARLESAFERTSGAVEDKRPLAAAYDYFVFEPAR